MKATVTRIEAELLLIDQRLSAGPDPFEHAGLYAAQQALRWVLEPDTAPPPYNILVRPSEWVTDSTGRFVRRVNRQMGRLEEDPARS